MDKCGQVLRPGVSEVLTFKAGARCGLKKSKEVGEFTLARKAAKLSKVPVPQTDTGRRGENPKMNGITLVKELCKMTP